MALTTFGNPAGRINRLKGEILAHAIPVEVLGIAGMQKRMPKNQGDTVIYRRWLPYGATTTNANTMNRPVVSSDAHILQEGVTPPVDSLTPQDITVVLQQFGVLYGVTDRVVDLYEDDVPAEMKKQTGERMGLVREMVRWGVVKGGTNAFYQGGTSRATVDEKISLGMLRKISRNLQANHAKRITSILSASPDYATTPVEAAYLVFAHTDVEADIRDLPNFKHTSEYGNRKVVHEQEIGSCENFRFVLSPELASIPDSGAAIASTGLYSTTGTLIDVYPIIITGEDAWGQVSLRGIDSMDVTWIPPGDKTKDDPLGQRGYVGSKMYMSAVRLNEGTMAVLESGVTSL